MNSKRRHRTYTLLLENGMDVFQEGEEKRNIHKHVPSGLLGTRFCPTPSPPPHRCLPWASTSRQWGAAQQYLAYAAHSKSFQYLKEQLCPLGNKNLPEVS